MRILYYLAFLICFFTSISHSQNTNLLINKINSYQKGASLRHAQWSIYAEYVESGKVIIDLNSEQSLAPASGLKLFTTAAALDILGEDYRFETRLYYDGKISSDGILNGNLYIVGSGDPTLGSNMVKSSLPLDSLMLDWTAAIMKKGIRIITGAICSDDLLFDRNPVPDNWFWVDIGNYYGAGTSALCIHDNLYYLYFKPGSRVGSPAKVLRTEPVIAGLEFLNYVKTGRKGSGDNGYIYCAPGQYNATLRGTIPAGVEEFDIKGSIPDPALFAAQLFHKHLVNSGIKVTGSADRLEHRKVYKEGQRLYTTFSPALKDIVFMINKRSINLYCEQLLKAIAVHRGQTGSTIQGIKVIEQFLEDNYIPTEGLHLYDGSGLSRTNTVTTKITGKLLSFMTRHPAFKSFYNSLGIAGDPEDIGYFSNFGAGTIIAKNARIKSGLIERVRSHSGYLKDKSGKLIVFSIIANNYSGRLSRINKIHKEILIGLVNLSN